MLLNKYWLETRNRLYIGVVFIAALCLFFVLAQPWILNRWRMDELEDPNIYNPPWLLIARSNYSYFIWHFLYNYLLQFTWAIFTIMLALGGINHEQEKGSVLFTLSLPIKRSDLFLKRIMVGVIATSILAIVPALLIPSASILIGLHYDFVTAISHSVLFIAGGIVYYMFGVFINSVAKVESVAFFIAIGFIIVFYFLFQPYAEGLDKPFFLKIINLPGFISGSANAKPFESSLLTGFITPLIFSCLLFAVSYFITLKKDY